MTKLWREFFEISIFKRVAAVAFFLAMLSVSIYDTYDDIMEGDPIPNLVGDAIVSLFGLFGFVIFIAHYLRLHQQHRFEKKYMSQELERWKTNFSLLKEGFGQQVEQRFEAWHLTPAEQDVALFLLKGFSYKEIAKLRKTSERTTRHQALAVYAKSGVASRGELAGLFLEDFFETPVTTKVEGTGESAVIVSPADRAKEISH